jgi:hypothetical protein
MCASLLAFLTVCGLDPRVRCSQWKNALEGRRSSYLLAQRTATGGPPSQFRRAVFAEMNHSDAIIAVVFLLASVIWLIRLSDTDRKR